MPYIHVNVSKKLTAEKVEQLRLAIAERMPLLPGKTRNNTMIHIDTGCALTMGDDGEPCVFMEARLYQASPEEAKSAFAAEVSEAFVKLLDIPNTRIYMNIIELDHWASRGSYR